MKETRTGRKFYINLHHGVIYMNSIKILKVNVYILKIKYLNLINKNKPELLLRVVRVSLFIKYLKVWSLCITDKPELNKMGIYQLYFCGDLNLNSTSVFIFTFIKLGSFSDSFKYHHNHFGCISHFIII